MPKSPAGRDSRRLRAVEPAGPEATPRIPKRPPHNLPLYLSSFVGREREIAEVKRLLGDNRLLSLVGPGGCGKTRLALAVASKLEKDEEFEDGVWWVGLASLSDLTLVPQEVTSTLRVRKAQGRSLSEMLVEHLETKNLLLLLDNCEHLIDACAELADTLLHSCLKVRILATSREPLGVEGEISWPLPSLSMPDDPEHLRSVEQMGHYEALRLFVERAKGAVPSFELTEENAPAVARVCQRLDGMPLAIELAAARTKVLSVGQISERLDESFRLLATDRRTADPRHRTLRATIAWSHKLLSEEEQVLFRRLSVFAGGFTIESAEGVCAGDGIANDGVLNLLSRLVDKSMVFSVAEHQGSEEARYRLLETVRQYGWESLQESGADDEVRRRHANFFLKLAEEAEPHLKGRWQAAWMERLEREHDNLRAAMRWLLEEGETETAARLAWALWLFWWYHGHHAEGRRFADEILAKGDDLAPDLRAKVLWTRAMMSYGLESIERMEHLFEESAALFRRVGDRFGLGITLSGVGVAALQRGDMVRANALFEESLTLLREVGNKWGISNVLANLGMASLGSNDHERAGRHFEEALAISREVGDRLSGYVSLYNLALSSQARGDHERAAHLYVEGLRLAKEMSDKANAAYCLEGLAVLIAERGEQERAVTLFGASEALLEAVGAPLYAQVQDRGSIERTVEALRSQLDKPAFEALWGEGRAMTLEQAVEYALEKPEAPQKASEEAEEAPQAFPAGLSAREVEVLRLVARGMTNAQIAGELYISTRTVNAHLGSVYHKIGSSTRAEATRFALEHDLL